jgi:hypothetical protein
MIKWASKYFGSIPAVFIDGMLYALLGLFIFLQSYISSDEALKHISEGARWWTLLVVGCCATLVGAIKMFRSTAFSDHQEQKKAPVRSFTPTENTQTPVP